MIDALVIIPTNYKSQIVKTARCVDFESSVDSLSKEN